MFEVRNSKVMTVGRYLFLFSCLRFTIVTSHLIYVTGGGAREEVLTYLI